MCRKLAFAATALTLLIVPSALAAEPPTAASKASAVQAAPVQAPAAQAAPAKASAEHRAQASRSDPLTASVFWNREFDLDPNDEEAGLKLAAALRAMGKYDEAAQAAQTVSMVNPRNLEALMEAARAHLGKGNGFYAIEPARKAQAMAPRDWRPVSLLGVAYEQAQRPEEAEAAYRKALQLSPANPAVLNNLAMFNAAQGKAAEAETLLRQAVTQPGATIQVRQNLSLVLGLQGKLAEAETLLRQDLPPETVNNNLAYLRAARTVPAPGAPVAATRTWESVQKAGSGS